MKALDRFEKGLALFLRWFCVILFALLVILVTYQVVIRQVFNSGSAWTEAAARYLFIWQALIGMAYVIGENDDVAIDFLVRKLPATFAKIVEIVAHAFVASFAVVIMLIGGARFVTRAWDQTVELLPVTLGQVYLVIPISGALILFYSIIHILGILTRPQPVVGDEDIDLAPMQEERV